MALISWGDDQLPHKVLALQDASEHVGKVLCWASMIESDTLEQCKNLARMPFVWPHVAVMPDAHLGKGAAIGSVVPTVDAVIPSAVGVDLGCGMIAVRTNMSADELEFWIREGHPLEDLRDAVERAIPLSAGNYNKPGQMRAFTRTRINALDKLADDLSVSWRDFGGKTLRNVENWREQLGTLGGGNHFIELSIDQDRNVWLFLHSGSRGVGNALASKWIRQAQCLADKWHIPLASPDLAYFPADTDEFDQYIKTVQWAQRFALLNREEMMDRFMEAFTEWLDIGGHYEEERINCHHNYIQRENHFGKNLWVTRKGAIDAHRGKMGVIPGSMGNASFVVRGMGNAVGLCSAPHGAGRLYSRSEAKRRFTVDDLASQMSGIVYRHGEAWVDEIPSCYKPIAQVMEDASTLVEPVAVLRQLMNVKGT